MVQIVIFLCLVFNFYGMNIFTIMADRVYLNYIRKGKKVSISIFMGLLILVVAGGLSLLAGEKIIIIIAGAYAVIWLLYVLTVKAYGACSKVKKRYPNIG